MVERHLFLVASSTLIAILVGLPAGVIAAHRPRIGRPLLAVASIAQTVPSLALLGFLLPIPFIGGIGPRIAMPIHWGTLASPSYAASELSEPARRFVELTARAAPQVEVVVLQPGGRLALGLRAPR